MKEVTTRDMIESVKRELDYRNRLYPKWVDHGKMKEENAKWEIACMEKILLKLKEIEDQESKQLSLF